MVAGSCRSEGGSYCDSIRPFRLSLIAVGREREDVGRSRRSRIDSESLGSRENVGEQPLPTFRVAGVLQEIDDLMEGSISGGTGNRMRIQKTLPQS